MTISLRSIKALMQEKTNSKAISRKTVKLMQSHLETIVRETVLHASRIQDRENAIRAQVGEREKKILAEKHLKMALEGKFPELRFKAYEDSQT